MPIILSFKKKQGSEHLTLIFYLHLMMIGHITFRRPSLAFASSASEAKENNLMINNDGKSIPKQII